MFFFLKKGPFLFSVLACGILSLSPLYPQIVIEEGDEGSGDSDSEYWDKHFGFRFGASSARGLGLDSQRNYSYANLSWNDEFGWLALKFEGEAYYRDYSYVLKVKKRRKDDLETQLKNAADTAERERIQKEIDGLPSSFTYRTGESDLIYREANARISLSDSIELSLGYHTVVWGQVSGFSPVDYVMPIRFASGNLNFSKTNNRLPQQAAILSFFPIPQIEIQGYYFPELSFDAALREGFENQVYAESEEGSQRTAMGTSVELPASEVRMPFAYPDKSDEAQYAGRMLFYLDWITLGFTYYESWDQFSQKRNGKIEAVDGTDYNNKPVTYYQVIEKPRLARVKNFGFETAIPLGRWTLAIDGLQRTVPSSLSITDLTLGFQNRGTFNRPSSSSRSNSGIASPKAAIARKNLIDYLINKNDSKLSYESDEMFIAAELSADLDTWIYGFGLAHYDSTPREKGKKINELHKKLEEASNQNDEESSITVLPFINVGRYLSESKKDIIGLSAGFLGGVGVGLVLYFGQEYFESLQFGLSLEFIQLFSSNEAADALDNYELDSATYPALRWLFSYKF